MKAFELRDLENEDLLLREQELKEELFNLRFQLATGQLDNHARIKQAKTDIARIRTILREREIELWERQFEAATTAGTAGEAEEEAS